MNLKYSPNNSLAAISPPPEKGRGWFGSIANPLNNDSFGRSDAPSRSNSAIATGRRSYQPMILTCHAKILMTSSKQQGMVLFFALIALVVMSLAAVGLIRSVDTNTMIAGNLGFKQSATVSADSGVETALSWLNVNQATLTANNAANGYYATSGGNAKALAEASAKMATGVGITAGTDSSGNTISYVIQRMCKNVGVSNASHCLFGPPGEDSNAFSNCDASNPCLNAAVSDSLMYRVTVRVAGPKNTVSYTQAFVY